ncbi:MAG: hypothetical protein ACJ76N_18980 [Thermoanaerobaculia bacterium]
MAFRAEELTTQIFPAGEGLWACPESTVNKGKPCPENTKPPCPNNSMPIAPPGGPQEPRRPPKKAGAPDRDALVLLQGQLRDRLARGPAAAEL